MACSYGVGDYSTDIYQDGKIGIFDAVFVASAISTFGVFGYEKI